MSKRSRTSRQTTPTSATPTSAAPTTAATVAAKSATKAPAPAPAGRTRPAPATTARSPFERYRGAIIGVAVVAVLAVGAAFVFAGAAQPAYACSTILAPEPEASPAPDATPRLGQVTRDLGRAHVDTGQRVTYEFCPPTSGSHYNDPRNGPIATRVYGADDTTVPQGWIHNLEHGQMAVLYRCPEGCNEASQASLRALQEQLPASPLCGFPATSSVVVTRFDNLPTPYAAIVWGRVYFLDSLDASAITTFRQQSADRGPEPQCQNALPGASPSVAPSAAPSVAPSATPAP